MSIFIDRKFLLILSPRLERFAKKNDDLFNFRCPFCGDSHKNKAKTRGYVYRKADSYFYMCHNCGISTNLYNLLNHVDPRVAKEYTLERFRNGDIFQKETVANTEPEIINPKPVFKKSFNLESVAELPSDHYAKAYVMGRKIPEKYYDELYYAPDFKKFVEDLKIEKDGLKDNDPRLVIPFYDQDKNLLCFQGRALSDSKLRYITVKPNKDNSKMFGLDRLKKDETIYVFEGPIDSMFIPNSVATADSNLRSAAKELDRDKLVLVFDNEPRNRDIVRQMDQAIDEHYSIVIWPENMNSKDINEMIQEGYTSEDLVDIMETHTFVNLRAKMEFMKWKKINLEPYKR